jgi:hypothetical protein
MSEAFDLLEDGFDILAEEFFPCTLTKGANSAKCVGADVVEVKAMMDSGYDLDFDTAVEIKRAYFIELGIAQHDTVSLDDQEFTVKAIQRDKSDPCIRLGLKSIK